MIDTIICGDTLTVLRSMDSESIDCVITSPPYWGLRDYGIEGQLGLEPTFNEYIINLQTIFDEVYRVLKKTGTCWVNIGDTYNGAQRGTNSRNDTNKGDGLNAKSWIRNEQNKYYKPLQNLEAKSLCNIPFRFAISMTDHKWIQRNTIIWHKPSCMPSSAKDRFTVDFEYVFFFTKNKKYWFEQQFEALSEASLERMKYPVNQNTPGSIYPTESREHPYLDKNGNTKMHYNPAGRNKRAVWRINPQPFKDAHFAVFPEKLVEPMIKAGCPSAICDSCGVAFNTETVREFTNKIVQDPNTAKFYNAKRLRKTMAYEYDEKRTNIIKKCDCDTPTHAGIVLDPFVGSGTTCLVARKLGRHYIGIDLQSDYVDMARKRLSEVL